MNILPVMKPRIPAVDAVLPRLRAIEASGWFTNFGPQELELRERFAELLGARRECVRMAANATLALTGALTVLEAPSWRVPSFTFPASPAAVVAGCRRLEFGDINAEDWCLELERGYSGGAVPVVPLGANPNLTRWQHSGPTVIDAAASLGSLPKLSRLGPDQAIVFSLHATKVLGAGEGAVVVFGDETAARSFQVWTNFGFAGTRDSTIVATNAKMSEIQAAYAHAALDDWESERAEWSRARSIAQEVANDVNLPVFTPTDDSVNPYWIAAFPDRTTCELVIRVLDAHGIMTRRWWSRGCHRMPAFSAHATRPLPVTEQIADRYLGLPFFRDLTPQDGERVAAALRFARHQADAW